jgi:hypothetical protein
MSLSEFQVRVATLVLGLPEAAEFALAGGAALIVHDVTDRATRDLDCFGPTIDAVDRLRTSVVDACASEGLRVEVDQAGPGFARLQIADARDTTLLDLGYDPAFSPPIVTAIGAVRALDDLAGDKLLALFSRAAPRDFLDVAALLRRYSHDKLEERAAAKDRGFDRDVLADAFGVLPTIRRDRFEIDDLSYAQLLTTFSAWRDAIQAGRT